MRDGVAGAAVPGSPASRSAVPDASRGATPPGRPDRLHSLDAFRGLTIAAMLLVNNPGTWAAVYPPLRHAEWHGWTPTDLIFPYFLFIVGVSMTFSVAARRARGASEGDLVRGAVRRALILFGLGLLLHGFPNYLDLAGLRIPGVLQRIALAYLAASLILLRGGRTAVIAATPVLLLGYWALLSWVPVPGGEAGVLEPGRDLGAWLDRAVFGEAHLWSASRTWDPEGLLSTLPAIATVLTGIWAGWWLRSGRGEGAIVRGLLLAGAAATGAGLVWGLWFPINKPLWTSSYVVFTSGMAALTLAACYWIIDARGVHRGTGPFVAFGRNAILAFFLSGIFARLLGIIRIEAGGETVSLKTAIFETVFAPLAPPQAASLLFALAFVALWTAWAVAMHRFRLYVKV